MIIKNNEITTIIRVVSVGIIMFFCLSVFLQSASAEELSKEWIKEYLWKNSTTDEPSLNNPFRLKIYKNNAPEFAFITADDFLRHGVTPDGCDKLLDDRWSYNRKERFFIAFVFPKQLYGMSGTLKVIHGNKLIKSTSIQTIKEKTGMLGYYLSAEAFFTDGAGAGIYSFEWWLGRNGDQKLAAIQLLRITD